jgi:hypothetical protein
MPVTARRHKRFGVRPKIPGRIRIMQGERYVSVLMREAAMDARIYSKVSSPTDESRDQLRISVIKPPDYLLLRSDSDPD